MELIEGSETSAISIVTPGNYPKVNILHTGHGESLKSRNVTLLTFIFINGYTAVDLFVPVTSEIGL